MNKPLTFAMRFVFFALRMIAIIFPDNAIQISALVGILVLSLFQTNNPFASKAVTAEQSTEN